MATRTRKTADQRLAGVRVGHRMAGMDLTDTDEAIARRQLNGEITEDEAVAQAIAAARSER